ncbi:hypothetical protein GGH96_000119 [Coemansia sp. RSA 1972]|nr:hypothetical protein GGH96_000119 [Coemansia sp. RSA 1972]
MDSAEHVGELTPGYNVVEKKRLRDGVLYELVNGSGLQNTVGTWVPVLSCGAAREYLKAVHEGLTHAGQTRLLNFWFRPYSRPLMLTSDNGPQLTLAEFKEYPQRNRVQHMLTVSYHPQSDVAEAAVKKFKTTYQLSYADGVLLLSKMPGNAPMAYHYREGNNPADRAPRSPDDDAVTKDPSDESSDSDDSASGGFGAGGDYTDGSSSSSNEAGSGGSAEDRSDLDYTDDRSTDESDANSEYSSNDDSDTYDEPVQAVSVDTSYFGIGPVEEQNNEAAANKAVVRENTASGSVPMTCNNNEQASDTTSKRHNDEQAISQRSSIVVSFSSGQAAHRLAAPGQAGNEQRLA